MTPELSALWLTSVDWICTLSLYEESQHPEEDSSVEVFPLCLATSSDSKVELATEAVYKMKNYLGSYLNTDLVGIISKNFMLIPY